MKTSHDHKSYAINLTKRLPNECSRRTPRKTSKCQSCQYPVRGRKIFSVVGGLLIELALAGFCTSFRLVQQFHRFVTVHRVFLFHCLFWKTRSPMIHCSSVLTRCIRRWVSMIGTGQQISTKIQKKRVFD